MLSCRALLTQYHSLRAPIFNVISHVARGETQRQVLAGSGGNWNDSLDAFEASANAVSGLGDPTSPYVNVAANLSEAAWHLFKADSDAHDQCDPTAARNEVIIADYFAATVSREVASASARVADAAEPPPSIEARGGLCHW